MTGTFNPGDHLQVRRPWGYNHHGIYVSDERIIQFGGGISDKPRAAITAVPLKEFELDGTAAVVQHGRHTSLTGYLPAADEPWKIIARAEFLLALQPRLPYNLIGHNCEHIANMCVAGGYTESHQTRFAFGMRGLVSAPAGLWASYLIGQKRPLPKGLVAALVLSAIAGLGSIFIYNHQIKLFWEEVRRPWRAHEQALSRQRPPSEGTSI